MALFKHVTHYGPVRLSVPTIKRATPILHLGNPYPTPGGGQPLSYTWGCTKQLCGFEPSESWPHIIENLIVIVRWITATKALFLNNRILHEFQMYLMSCSQMSMGTQISVIKFMSYFGRLILLLLCVSPLNGTTSLKWLSMFVQDNCVFLLWMVQPLWNGCPCLYRTIQSPQLHTLRMSSIALICD